MFVVFLPIPGFSRCSAPKYSFSKYYGAMHLLDFMGDHFSININGALHLSVSGEQPDDNLQTLKCGKC
jgi:hypothetical protein